jgi:hypothetical protein
MANREQNEHACVLRDAVFRRLEMDPIHIKLMTNEINDFIQALEDEFCPEDVWQYIISHLPLPDFSTLIS